MNASPAPSLINAGTTLEPNQINEQRVLIIDLTARWVLSCLHLTSIKYSLKLSILSGLGIDNPFWIETVYLRRKGERYR